tara:strand:- start:38 stop:817 length:780 start_codon:yes stop_codon:yes gene_type:complete
MSKNTSARKRATKNGRRISAKKVAKKAAKSKSDPKKVMELRVRRMSLGDLHEHPRNSEVRKHPEQGSADWDVLTASLTHDYFDPLVWNERNGQLVSGHLRRKVMESMGIERADVVVVDYDEPTHIARLLAANNLLGRDDKKGMKEFLTELSGTKRFDMDITGFSSESLKDKFDLSPAKKQTEGTEHGDGNDGSSASNYEAPRDSVPLALSYPPNDHIEVMGLIRTARKSIADNTGKPMSDVTNSDAVAEALRQFSPQEN